MSNLLSYFLYPLVFCVAGALFIVIIKVWLHRRKSPDTISINIAGVEELRVINIASVEELRESFKERGIRLSKEQDEKIKSCFAPGVKELEAGKKLLQYGEEAQAKYHLEEAIKFFICAADALPCYETFYNLARAYQDYCGYDNAKENYQKAIQHDPTQPGAYNGLGIVYYYTGDYPKAQEYYQQTLAKAEKLTDQEMKLNWQAAALDNLGIVYSGTGQMEQALEHHKQALIIQREIGNRLGEANALMNLGNVYYQTGQMEQALEHHKQALVIQREIGNKLGEANSLTNLGNVYRQTGRMEQAMEYQQHAVMIFREIENKLGHANALSNLGMVYTHTGRMEEALVHYQQVLKIHREIGNKYGEANDLNNLGIVYRDIGQIEQAREHFLLARAIFEQIGAPHLVKQVDENLAKLPGG